MANTSKSSQKTTSTSGRWVAGKQSCPHSSDEICGPCRHAIEVRESMSRETLTPHAG